MSNPTVLTPLQIARDLARRLPRVGETEIGRLAAYIHDRGLARLDSWGRTIDYAPELADVAPRLFDVPTVAPNASPREKVEVADRLARWIESSIEIPADDPPRRAPTAAEQKIIDADALAARYAAILAGEEVEQ